MFTDHLNIARKANCWAAENRSTANIDQLAGLKPPLHGASVRKVPAHATEAMLAKHSDIPDCAFIANDIADSVAGAAGAKSAVPSHTVELQREAEQQWLLVCQRALHIYRLWRSELPENYLVVERLDEALVRQRKTPFAQLVCESGHRVTVVSDRLVCTVCRSFSPRCILAKRRWLKTCCQLNSFARPKLHATHRFSCGVGFFRCVKCLLSVDRPRALAARCKCTNRRRCAYNSFNSSVQSLSVGDPTEQDLNPNTNLVGNNVSRQLDWHHSN